MKVVPSSVRPCSRRITTELALIANVVTTMKEDGRTTPMQDPAEGRKRTVLRWRPAGPLAVMPVVTAVSLTAAAGRPPTAPPFAPLRFALAFAQCMRTHGFPSSRTR